MIVFTQHQGKEYSIDLSNPMDISIPLNQGLSNPNCYYAPPVQFETIRAGDFIGSVAEGGSVNYQTIKITPHGNGTHTECYGHISTDPDATINRCLRRFHFTAQLITMQPKKQASGDWVIDYDDFIEAINSNVEAIIIRTIPNDSSKKKRQYSGTNPCYLDPRIGRFLSETDIKHLLLDLPSVDKEVDGGALSAHRAFWNMDQDIRKDCTISELIFVDDEIQDGLYLLNLQITSLEADASPSKPVIYKMVEC